MHHESSHLLDFSTFLTFSEAPCSWGSGRARDPNTPCETPRKKPETYFFSHESTAFFSCDYFTKVTLVTLGPDMQTGQTCHAVARGIFVQAQSAFALIRILSKGHVSHMSHMSHLCIVWSWGVPCGMCAFCQDFPTSMDRHVQRAVPQGTIREPCTNASPAVAHESLPRATDASSEVMSGREVVTHCLLIAFRLFHRSFFLRFFIIFSSKFCSDMAKMADTQHCQYMQIMQKLKSRKVSYCCDELLHTDMNCISGWCWISSSWA